MTSLVSGESPLDALRLLAASACCAVATHAAASCGSAFCLVDTDGSAQGNGTEPGLRFDWRYESVDLDRPRVGTRDVAVGEIPRHHDEIVTKNRNLVAAFDWNLAPQWGLSIAVPYVDRHHEHIHNHEGEKELETWDFRELGDVRVVARREITASRDDIEQLGSWGILFGAKLPTGKHDVVNADGEAAERTLQPGTGTTDAILGLYVNGIAPLANTSWFARAHAVLALNEREGYKPGRHIQVDAGIRYAVARDVGLMLQAN